MPDRHRTPQRLTHDFFPCNSKSRRLLEISSYIYTGPNLSKTHPGVGFELFVAQDALLTLTPYLEVEIEGQKMLRINVGVMDRDAVRRLHELTGDFLKDFQEETS